MQLYASEHFRLIGVRVSGKKKVAGGCSVSRVFPPR